MKNFKALILAILACPLASAAMDHKTEAEVREKFIDPVMVRLQPQFKFRNSEAIQTGYKYEYFDEQRKDRSPISITIEYVPLGDAESDRKHSEEWRRKAADGKGPEKFEPSLGEGAISYDISKVRPKEMGGWVQVKSGSRSAMVHSFGTTLEQLRILAQALLPLIPQLPKPTNFHAELNEKRLGMDRALISKLVPALKKDPPDLSALQRFSSDDVYLGFGYVLSEFGAASGGYVSPGGLGLFSKEDHLLAIRTHVTPNFPRNVSPEDAARLHDILKQIESVWHLKPSETIQSEIVGYHDWHYEQAAKPLSNELLAAKYKPDLLNNHPDKQTITFLMTPFSGLEYGTRGGIAGDLLQNRKEFLKLTRLDEDTCVYLMHSKNPVTRLTAIETLMRNAVEWKIDLKKYEQDFQMIFRSHPSVQTLEGKIAATKPSEPLVKALSKIPLKEIEK